MTTAYERSTLFSKSEDGRRRVEIDESWHQGRGAFGGVLAALMLRAMREEVNDAERIPRSLTVHFPAPAVGPLELTTEIVRTGRAVTHATARVSGARGVTTFGSASFCKDRPGPEHYAHAVMPEVEEANALPSLPLHFPGLPAFFANVDARFCGPTKPFSSSPSKDARIMAWVRLREAVPIDAPVAALLLDALPPAIDATFAAPRPLASVDFTVHFFARLPLATSELADDEHCLVSIASRWAGDGYTEELRELWSPRGHLLAQCRQLIALL